MDTHTTADFNQRNRQSKVINLSSVESNPKSNNWQFDNLWVLLISYCPHKNKLSFYITKRKWSVKNVLLKIILLHNPCIQSSYTMKQFMIAAWDQPEWSVNRTMKTKEFSLQFLLVYRKVYLWKSYFDIKNCISNLYLWSYINGRCYPMWPNSYNYHQHHGNTQKSVISL